MLFRPTRCPQSCYDIYIHGTLEIHACIIWATVQIIMTTMDTMRPIVYWRYIIPVEAARPPPRVLAPGRWTCTLCSLPRPISTTITCGRRCIVQTITMVWCKRGSHEGAGKGCGTGREGARIILSERRVQNNSASKKMDAASYHSRPCSDKIKQHFGTSHFAPKPSHAS